MEFLLHWLFYLSAVTCSLPSCRNQRQLPARLDEVSITAAYLWSLADLLRDDFKQSQHARVILPFTILRSCQAAIVVCLNANNFVGRDHFQHSMSLHFQPESSRDYEAENLRTVAHRQTDRRHQGLDWNQPPFRSKEYVKPG